MTTRIDNLDNPYRISPAVVPSAYRLRLRPDLAAATFAGTVEIAIAIAQPVHAIVLNAIELEVEPFSRQQHAVP